jgi:hypothetical protein
MIVELQPEPSAPRSKLGDVPPWNESAETEWSGISPSLHRSAWKHLKNKRLEYITFTYFRVGKLSMQSFLLGI